MKKFLLAAVVFVLALAVQSGEAFQDYTFSGKSLQEWKFNTAQGEFADGSLRVRAGNQKRNWGSFWQRMRLPEKEGWYFQVLMGENEHSSAEPVFSNTGSGGKKYGPIFRGWNTFFLGKTSLQKSFVPTFIQSGGRNGFSPWCDYRRIRIVQTPVDGLVIRLQNPVLENGLVKEADLALEYRSSEYLAAAPAVKFFIVPNFVPCSLSGQEKLVLQCQKDNVFTGSLHFSSEKAAAVPLVKRANQFLLAVVSSGLHQSHTAVPFSLKLKYVGNARSRQLQAATAQVYADRSLWQKLTGKRKNLARGRRVEFSTEPAFSLTAKNRREELDLTDGLLCRRNDDKLWFAPEAVGFIHGSGNYMMKIDLGKVAPVDSVVIRILGGTAGNFRFPNELTAYFSRDDSFYYKAASLIKLQPGEKDQSDFRRFYYLPETAGRFSTRVYPFALQTNAEARYVILEAKNPTSLFFADEVAVLEGRRDGASFNDIYQSTGLKLPFKGLIIAPRQPMLAIIPGLPAAQRFLITDNREKQDQGKEAEVLLDLPEGVSVIGEKAAENLQIKGRNYHRYRFPVRKVRQKLQVPELFLQAAGKIAAPAYMQAVDKKKQYFRTELAIVQPEALPKIPRFRRLHIGLAWMHGNNVEKKWPDFFRNYSALGFNSVSLIPVNYYLGRPEQEAAIRAFCARAEKQQLDLCMVDCTFHIMANGKPAGHEIFCQIPGEPNKKLCPSYYGAFYQKELQRVTENVLMIRPKYLFYDTEAWGAAASSSLRCTRCRQELKKSGLSESEFLFRSGTRRMADLKKSITEACTKAGIAVPVFGSYNRQAAAPLYDIEDFNRIYPASLDLAMPSLYVAGRGKDIRTNIRANYAKMKCRKIIPWLTAGTYGEFDSYKMEPMILEALLNGAGGITYYKYDDFADTPLDFYYHARALSRIREYEDLICDGKPVDIPHAGKLTVSAVRKQNSWLVLISNYEGISNGETITLPVRNIVSSKCLQKEKYTACSGRTIQARIPRNGFQLLYLQTAD